MKERRFSDMKNFFFVVSVYYGKFSLYLHIGDIRQSNIITQFFILFM